MTDATVRVRPDLTVVELDGETVVFDPDSGTTHHLNVTATSVFRSCDGRRRPDDVVAQVAREFGLDAGDVEQDVRRTLEELQREALVVPEAAVSGLDDHEVREDRSGGPGRRADQ